MSGPDYPLLAIPGHDLYQLAQVATFIADRLHQHRRAVANRNRPGRRTAARDVHAGRAAYATLSGHPELRSGPLPRPLDTGTYDAANRIAREAAAERRAEVVSLAALGRSSWAVVGAVPGVGNVGAEVPTREVAEAVASHIRTQPVTDIAAAWAVSEQPLNLGMDRWGTADETAALQALDMTNLADQAVATALGATPSANPATVRPESAVPQQPAAASVPLDTTTSRPVWPAFDDHPSAFAVAATAMTVDTDELPDKLLHRAGPTPATHQVAPALTKAAAPARSA
jgi:hypothetical protein